MKENSLFDSLLEEPQKPSGPVTCLGMTFENDEARRAHFTEQLRKKLQDPEFRKIEGFPIGSDEDILNLSDPPYYTACPNPWIADFIAEWEVQKPEQSEGYHYHREPFAADVSEGKNDPIYNAHSYHTKVPHKAIMRYILHYTQPGDIVFDGFCGTGMTGVAAQMCGSKETVQSLGYRVLGDDSVLDSEGHLISCLGKRNAVITDLAPVATFISNNLNNPISSTKFKVAYRKLSQKVSGLESEIYTAYTDEGSRCGVINYVIWSDAYICTECSHEFVYWDVGVDLDEGEANKIFDCPSCGAKQSTRSLQRSYETTLDPLTKLPIKIFKQKPVRISYIPSGKKKLQKEWSAGDEKSLKTIAADGTTLASFPIIEMPRGDRWRRDAFADKGVTHLHNFYTTRTIVALSKILDSIKNGEFDYKEKNSLLFLFTSFADRNATKRNRFIINKHNPQGRVNGPMANCLYLPNLFCEMNILRLMDDKQKDILSALQSHGFRQYGRPVLNTGSSSNLVNIPTSSVDYIFTDPPFGHNIQYSELNFGLESFLGVKSRGDSDAVVNEVVGKSLLVYTDMMSKAFSEYYRILKPGKWMTVEFHNSKASVWNSIQEAMGKAGFVIAHVATLDKKQKTVHQDTHVSGTVNQDLIISAYKPNGGLEDRFKLSAGTETGVWDFIRTHLSQLPVFIAKAGKMEIIAERLNYLLFDRMVAFHVQRGVSVPLSASDFYQGLSQRFSERDGMFFLHDQTAEYDKKRINVKSVEQLSLFVSDEASAIQWLRQNFKEKPQTFQEVHPHFIQEAQRAWSKAEIPLELSTLLEQNFLRYDGKGPVPEQVHAYLSTNWKELRNLPKDDPTLIAKARDRWYVPDPNKAGDLEKLREKALLKEFVEYKEVKKKLKVFRLEAVRAGFKKAWQERDYAVIVAVADKIPNNILEEDPKLLMWYDQAVTRMGGE